MLLFFLIALIATIALVMQFSKGKPQEAYLVAEPLTDGTVLEIPPTVDPESGTENDPVESLHLKFGENKDVHITINKDALSFYDETSHAWKAEKGEFEALIGNASDNITSKVKFRLN